MRPIGKKNNKPLTQMEKYNGMYRVQKSKAIKKRHIAWKLTFEEWMKIWNDSGHLAQRGRGMGKYQMCRFGDKGGYEIGNVSIKLHEENSSEKQMPEDFKARQRQRKPTLGRSLSEEHKEKLRQANLGKRATSETRLKMSISRGRRIKKSTNSMR